MIADAGDRYTEKSVDALAGRARRAFWEFVSGPLNAGAFPASDLDGTFGPERVFVKAPTASNVSPAGGYQFFGEVGIDGDSAELTVRLREQDGTVLFTKILRPGRVGQ